MNNIEQLMGFRFKLNNWVQNINPNDDLCEAIEIHTLQEVIKLFDKHFNINQ